MYLECLKVSVCRYDNEGKETVVSAGAYPIENNKIPRELVQSFIIEKKVTTEKVFGKVNTILKYKLANGFTGVESATCVDEANYSAVIGEEILLKRLEEKIWFALGFALGMATK